MSADVEGDVRAIERFNDRHRDARHGAVQVDTLELKAAHPEEIRTAGPFIGSFDAFIELPIAEDPEPLITAIGDLGAKAKSCTGFGTPEVIPDARQVLRFIRRCTEHAVPFKATAGLHHPIRVEHPLTYEPDGPRGVMYGFLNVFLTAAFVRHGLDDAAALDLLQERDASALHVDDDRVQWRGHAVTTDQLRVARHDIVAFGSCSFREPVDELRALGLR